jgi:hypothetical protein
MSYPEYKVLWYKKTSVTGEVPAWEGVGTEISEFLTVEENEAISDGNKVKADTFALSLSNTDVGKDGKGDLTYNISNDDLIEISLRRDGGTWVQVMSGKVTKFSQKISNTARIIKIEGVNRTQSLLRTVFALNLQDDKPPMMVASLLAEANENNDLAGVPNKINYVYYNEDNAQYENQDGILDVVGNLTIQRYENDGSTEFTSVSNFTSWFDPAYHQLQKLSSLDMTGDGNYLFWVDNENNFYWQGKSTTVSATLTEGTDMLSVSLKNSVDRVINFFVIHCGTAPDGYGVITYYSNDESIAAHGLSGKFIDMTFLSDQLMKLEAEADTSKFDATFPKGTNGFYPTAAALAVPYTMTFKPRYPYEVGGVSYGVGDAITVDSQAKYNEAITKECKARGETEAGSKLSYLGVALWTANISVLGTTSYNKSNILTLDIPSQGWTGVDTKDMRIYEIVHSFGRKGWVTDLFLREDEESV